ncbi:MAG: sulfite reductase subunit A, partial [Thiotrichaceae bacterium]
MTFLAHRDLSRLFDVLKLAGYQCVAPQVRDGTIVYDILDNLAQLPRGVSDQQSPGKYRLTQTDSPRYFAWANGAEALKPMTFAPREILWKAERDVQGNLQFVESPLEFKPLAIFGVRACDLAALHILDQHFAYNTYADKYYNARRRQLLFISVDCSHPAPTCFCAST